MAVTTKKAKDLQAQDVIEISLPKKVVRIQRVYTERNPLFNTDEIVAVDTQGDRYKFYPHNPVKVLS